MVHVLTVHPQATPQLHRSSVVPMIAFFLGGNKPSANGETAIEHVTSVYDTL